MVKLKGIVASKPVNKMYGEIYNFEEKRGTYAGKILVVEQTYPNMMDYVTKAKAIIAETGGILSHAAIVSRELQIPCVVCVKNATKILKTGYTVELDLEEGTIKILKRKTNFA